MAKKETIELVNPFNEGTTYTKFLTALGNTSIKEYLKDVCTNEEIEWIEIEINNYKLNNLNK
jgi:hypothetical protein